MPWCWSRHSRYLAAVRLRRYSASTCSIRARARRRSAGVIFRSRIISAADVVPRGIFGYFFARDFVVRAAMTKSITPELTHSLRFARRARTSRILRTVS